MGSKSKSSQSTQATQNTTNTDSSLNAGENSVLIGAGATVNVNDISAEVATKALEINSEVTKANLALAGDTTGQAFDYLQTAGSELLEFVTNARQEAQYEKLRNQDLTANLASQSFALADEKTQSSDDKVFNFGRTALLIGAGILALFFIIPAFKSDSKKQP